jgi:hypothetical protein
MIIICTFSISEGDACGDRYRGRHRTKKKSILYDDGKRVRPTLLLPLQNLESMHMR